MSGTSIESQLEFVVIEGESRDTRQPLRWSHIALGRWQDGDEATPERLGFTEPTVSRNHAELVWDSRKSVYTLNHLSSTNATVINGTQVVGSKVLQVGDEIRLGRLLLRLRDIELPKALEAIDSGYRLLVLSGPEKGTLHKIPSGRSSLVSPKAGAIKPGEIHIAGLLENHLELQERTDFFEIEGVELPNSLKIYNSWPGLLQECPVSVQTPFPVRANTLVVCALASFVIVPEAQSQINRAEVLASKPIHAALAHIPELSPGGPSFVFQAPQEHTLRALSGPLRTHKLWIEPRNLDGPIHFGKHPDAVLPLEEEPHAALSWTAEGPVLKNVDERLNVGLNWEELPPGSQRTLCSGDRFKLGSSAFVYEYYPIQRHLDRLVLRHDEEELRFARAVGLVGSDSMADFFINSDELAETHGRIRVDASGLVFYQHLDPSSTARVGGTEIRTGEEELVKPGEPLLLAPDVEVKLARH